MSDTTTPTLDFTDLDHRAGEWCTPDGARYRFLDRSSGTGFFRWHVSEWSAWVFHNVMVFDGPFTRVPQADELGEDADWDEGWVIDA